MIAPEPAGTDVLILCGGLGTRLRSAVSDRPKPMAAIADRPFIGMLVDHLRDRGFSRFILGTGYMGEQIKKYFSECRIAGISVIHEREPLGTAGGLANIAIHAQSDPVLVLNGDSFCEVDYPALLRRHSETGASCTLVVVPSGPSSDCGNVTVSKDGEILSFQEKSGEAGLVNAGIYLFSRSCIKAFPTTRPLSLEKQVFPKLAGKRLFAYSAAGPLLDIGTPERYDRAIRELGHLMKASGQT